MLITSSGPTARFQLASALILTVCSTALILPACSGSLRQSSLRESLANETQPKHIKLSSAEPSQEPATKMNNAAIQCGQDLRAFPCESQRWCKRTLPADGIDAEHLLCTAATIANTPDGLLRVADILASLPSTFTRNFVLKHGHEEQGARGHEFERMEDLVSKELAAQSQSSTPEFPRTILWDDLTGLSIAFNGGVSSADGTEVTGGDRLDIHTFDTETATFGMWALDLPIKRSLAHSTNAWQILPTIPDEKDDNCTTCHGPHRRPIWPMYPDWPGFFGSDNDELGDGTPAQKRERQELAKLRLQLQNDPEKSDPRRRYSTLFSTQQATYLDLFFASTDTESVRHYLKQRDSGDRYRPERLRLSAAAKVVSQGSDSALQPWLGLELHPKYPFRPNEQLRLTEASRAFFHRPNLRIGLLYNRLLALHISARIKKSLIYRSHRELIIFQLLDCTTTDKRAMQLRLQGLLQEAQPQFATLGLPVLPSVDSRLSLPMLLALFELQVRDVDIRFTYTNPEFDAFDTKRAAEGMPAARNIMALGTLEYAAHDYNLDNGASEYFNSYWDGSATFVELLVAQLIVELDLGDSLFELNSLRRKYEDITSRQVLDARFFTAMDNLSGWFPLPYPKALEEVHHRQSFHLSEAGSFPHRTQYKRVCEQLDQELRADQ